MGLLANSVIHVDFSVMPLVMRARGNARTESAKIRNRRTQKKVYRPPCIWWKMCYVMLELSVFLRAHFVSNPLNHGFQLLDQYNGTPKRPRLSVFCSGKQLYAMLVDDQNKNCLFYGSTLQKSVRQNSPCSTSVSAPQACVRKISQPATVNLENHIWW